MRTKLVVTAVFLFIISLPSVALSNMCYKPTKPSCVDSYSEFWSRFEAESCKDDVERFANDMKVYQMCLQDEFSFVKREVDSTISEFVDKVKRSDNMR